MPRGPGVGERLAGPSSPAGPRPGGCSFRQSLLHRPCTCCAPGAGGPGTPGGPGLVTPERRVPECAGRKRVLCPKPVERSRDPRGSGRHSRGGKGRGVRGRRNRNLSGAERELGEVAGAPRARNPPVQATPATGLTRRQGRQWLQSW